MTLESGTNPQHQRTESDLLGILSAINASVEENTAHIENGSEKLTMSYKASSHLFAQHLAVAVLADEEKAAETVSKALAYINQLTKLYADQLKKVRTKQ